MKNFFLTILTLASLSLYSQDEYQQKKTEKPEEPVQLKTDSIELSKPVKKEKVEAANDDSKAFKGISEFKRNLRVGGAFNIGSYSVQAINNQALFFMVSPQLTYILSDVFEGGISTSYTYVGSFDRLNSHAFSAGPILRAYFLDQFFLQVEGVAFYNSLSLDNYPVEKITSFNAFVGGGFVSRFSETSYLLTGVKVNLMKNAMTYNQTIPSAFTSIHFGLW